jgi:carbonic anhydrase
MSSYAAQHLPAANEAYVKAFGNKGSLPLPPGKHVAVLGCMDARLYVPIFFSIVLCTP